MCRILLEFGNSPGISSTVKVGTIAPEDFATFAKRVSVRPLSGLSDLTSSLHHSPIHDFGAESQFR